MPTQNDLIQRLRERDQLTRSVKEVLGSTDALSRKLDAARRKGSTDATRIEAQLKDLRSELVDRRQNFCKRPTTSDSNVLSLILGPDVQWRIGGLLREFLTVSLARARGRHRDSVVSAANTLETLPVDTTDRLFCECLDLSTHRLDAWFTSLVTRRLEATRHIEKSLTGTYIGAYGWLEDLRPKFDNDAGGSTGGFIHAPSIGQANAAAVLRSAYQTYAAKRVLEAAAAKVNLSSERVLP